MKRITVDEDIYNRCQQPLLIFNDSKEPYKSEGACLKWIRQVPG